MAGARAALSDLEDRACRAMRGPFAGTDQHLDAPFWATPDAVVARMLDLAGVTPADRLIDLGCGDGRICIAAARRGARALGIDIDAERIAEARAAASAAGVERLVDFRQEDLFETRLEAATVVALYTLPLVHNLLGRRLQTELAPGSRVVAHAWTIEGWAPDHIETLADRRILYLWTVSGNARSDGQG